jgi:hypothetical protein
MDGATVLTLRLRRDQIDRIATGLNLCADFAEAEAVHYETTGARDKGKSMRELARSLREDFDCVNTVRALAESALNRVEKSDDD